MDQLYVERFFRSEDCDWLVFLHGFGGNTKTWNRQVRHFKEKYNLLVIDLPGHGNSKVGIANKGIRKFEQVADMVAETVKANGIDRAIFVCVSLGTLVLGGLLSKHRYMVKGAILCGAIMGINIFLKILLKVFNKVKFCFPYMFLMELFSRFLLPFKAHQLSRKFFMRTGKLLGKEEFMAWCNLFVADLDVLKNIKDIGDNVLFITGDEDFTFINGVKKRLNKLHQNRLKIMSHCGHVCNMQKWREFNEISLNFLENVA